ncbi:unnamed protein product [Sympodiomycopsis kandeliae]
MLGHRLSRYCFNLVILILTICSWIVDGQPLLADISSSKYIDASNRQPFRNLARYSNVAVVRHDQELEERGLLKSFGNKVTTLAHSATSCCSAGGNSHKSNHGPSSPALDSHGSSPSVLAPARAHSSSGSSTTSSQLPFKPYRFEGGFQRPQRYLPSPSPSFSPDSGRGPQWSPHTSSRKNSSGSFTTSGSHLGSPSITSTSSTHSTPPRVQSSKGKGTVAQGPLRIGSGPPSPGHPPSAIAPSAAEGKGKAPAAGSSSSSSARGTPARKPTPEAGPSGSKTKKRNPSPRSDTEHPERELSAGSDWTSQWSGRRTIVRNRKRGVLSKIASKMSHCCSSGGGHVGNGSERSPGSSQHSPSRAGSVFSFPSVRLPSSHATPDSSTGLSLSSHQSTSSSGRTRWETYVPSSGPNSPSLTSVAHATGSGTVKILDPRPPLHGDESGKAATTPVVAGGAIGKGKEKVAAAMSGSSSSSSSSNSSTSSERGNHLPDSKSSHSPGAGPSGTKHGKRDVGIPMIQRGLLRSISHKVSKCCLPGANATYSSSVSLSGPSSPIRGQSIPPSPIHSISNARSPASTASLSHASTSGHSQPHGPHEHSDISGPWEAPSSSHSGSGPNWTGSRNSDSTLASSGPSKWPIGFPSTSAESSHTSSPVGSHANTFHNPAFQQQAATSSGAAADKGKTLARVGSGGSSSNSSSSGKRPFSSRQSGAGPSGTSHL